MFFGIIHTYTYTLYITFSDLQNYMVVTQRANNFKMQSDVKYN